MYHLKCSSEDIAARAIVCGDPARSERAYSFLKDARLVNRNRCLLTYTGYFGSERVTISTTGMGTPSAAIVMEELAALGIKCAIRVGTTGGIGAGIRLGDVIIPSEALPLDGATNAYLKLGGKPLADPGIVEGLSRAAEKLGMKSHVGKICTSDTFYLEEERDATAWASRGVLSFEMECAVIFTLGKLRGYKAGGILTVTGRIADQEERILEDASASESIDKSIMCALEVASKIGL